MAFMKTEQYESTPNILESEVGLVLKTYTADQTNAETVGTKKIIKAGSVYPTNTTDAIGIVFEMVYRRNTNHTVKGQEKCKK